MIYLYIMQCQHFRTRLYTDDVMRSVNSNLALARYGITFILTQE